MINKPIGGVYVLKSSLKKGIVKIGATSDFDRRLEQLRMQSKHMGNVDEKLEFAGLFHFEDKYKLETYLHNMLKDKKIVSEWYAVEFHLINKLAEKFIKNYKKPICQEIAKVKIIDNYAINVNQLLGGFISPLPTTIYNFIYGMIDLYKKQFLQTGIISGICNDSFVKSENLYLGAEDFFHFMATIYSLCIDNYDKKLANFVIIYLCSQLLTEDYKDVEFDMEIPVYVKTLIDRLDLNFLYFDIFEIDCTADKLLSIIEEKYEFILYRCNGDKDKLFDLLKNYNIGGDIPTSERPFLRSGELFLPKNNVLLISHAIDENTKHRKTIIGFKIIELNDMEKIKLFYIKSVFTGLN